MPSDTTLENRHRASRRLLYRRRHKFLINRGNSGCHVTRQSQTDADTRFHIQPRGKSGCHTNRSWQADAELSDIYRLDADPEFQIKKRGASWRHTTRSWQTDAERHNVYRPDADKFQNQAKSLETPYMMLPNRRRTSRRLKKIENIAEMRLGINTTQLWQTDTVRREVDNC
jgi:hypothetical protein